MTGLTLALTGFALMLGGIFLRVPIALAMALTGFFGTWYVLGSPAAPMAQNPVIAIARAIGTLFNISSVVITHSGGVHFLQSLPKPLATGLAHFLSSGPITFVSHIQKT